MAEARVIKRRIAQGAWKRACFAPKVALVRLSGSDTHWSNVLRAQKDVSPCLPLDMFCRLQPR